MVKSKLTAEEEIGELQVATDMASMGARMQVIESETSLPRSRLVALYKEVTGNSPPKGLLPSSGDWFLPWMRNIESSLFANYYYALIKRDVNRKSAMIKGYRFYQDQMLRERRDPLLSFSRAWTLIRFIDADVLKMKACEECGIEFVIDEDRECCHLCRPPKKAIPVKRY